MGSFTHLHVHTQYSLLDGAVSIEKLMEKAVEMNMDSIAITDHGAMYGVIDFYLEAKKKGIKPIIGCEVYTAPRSRFDKVHNIDSKYGHLVLLAKDNIGYKNLMAISSIGFMDGYYYKPRVDIETLTKHSGGIIALSACLRGDIPQAIAGGDINKAKEIAEKFVDIYGKENFYFEIQNHSLELENVVEKALIELSEEMDIGLVATNDVHYVEKDDALMQDILVCIQTGKKLSDSDRLKFVGEDYYLKSPSEMKEIFSHVPSAIENTNKIADMCNVDIDFNSMYLPKFFKDGVKDNAAYLKELCERGIEKKYNIVTDEIVSRLCYELDTINSMGYTDYFLIVWDFIKYAKGNGIIVGPGRGSAAGSIVSYALDITEVDPIKYNLLFERFLNSERVSMPDIDIDFCYVRRDEVKKYVVDKYGKEHVAHIATFGTMAARAAVRDVGRVLDIPYSEVDAVAKAIPGFIHITLSDALKQSEKLKKMYDTSRNTKKIIDIAMRIEGFPRHVSTHAAGIVITDDVLYNYVPVTINEQGLLTQFSMNALEKLGILKMDFLGLRNLTIIDNAISLVKKYKNIDLNDIGFDYDDVETYKMISKGDTDGVFQLESTGVKHFLKKLRLEKLEDIIAATSLYRPGPMEQIPSYLKNRRNPDEIVYKDERLRPILEPTYGTLVYQEQVMQLVRTLAGYSLVRADLVRRMMSKKQFDVMMREKEIFLNGLKDESGKVIILGALNNGVPKDVAEDIFSELTEFANYAFNKSHAAAYAMVAYKTAYLKCHYPTEFLAALLKNLLGNSYRVSKYVADFTKYGIRLLPPDVQKSDSLFTVEGKDVRFGLSALKNVGYNFPKRISEDRDKNGEFLSFEDFIHRMSKYDINKRTIEVLIKSGAFDSIQPNRRMLALNSDRLIDNELKEVKSKSKDQINWFEDASQSGQTVIEKEDCEDYSFREKLMFENEYSGMYLSGHPLDEYRLKAAAFSDTNILKIYEETPPDNTVVRLCGVVKYRNDKRSKNAAIISTMVFEDFYSNIELVAFSPALSKNNHVLTIGNALSIIATVKNSDDGTISLMLKNAYDLRMLNISDDKKLYLRLKDNEMFESVKQIISDHKGTIPVYIYFEDADKIICTSEQNRIKLSNELIKLITNLLGDDNIRIK